MTLSSNNKFHQHVHSMHSKIKTKWSVSIILSSKPKSKTTLNHVDVYAAEIIKSDAVNIIDKSECSFHNWHYITLIFWFETSGEGFIKTVCLNTECTMSLIDRKFLFVKISTAVIQKMTSKITVCSIDSQMHECQKFVQLNLYLSDILDGKMMMTHIIRDVHLVDSLWTNLLIDMNIIESE